ncbi:MBL fold metallo-hydrolase [Fusibacter ferrireducens]|uniref:MBL fold metallo-hydrolase n=1 Tax=Fusibacter ferrireducens TaxID=2785058 RepID=A0ABR9ZR08_9FIRM|nr:MBL fold metallo-hydrolase [Fusibacter ferrireducens]MBF4692416.1 MBL fold metallo-hydrolase [Fusibacter ferrireducens]
MEKLIILDLKFKFGEIEDVIHPVVVKGDDSMILIDCGYTGFLEKLEAEMNLKGLKCDDLTHVLITHQDHDHMGALAELKAKYPHILVVASEKEAPYISGELKSLRLTQAEEMQAYLPEEQKAFGEAFCDILRAVKPVAVDHKVKEGDHVAGCTIIETSGHTPGHISVYVQNLKTIITGDAIALENGKPVIANPQFTLDLKEAEASLNKILAREADQVICYHGGIIA